MRRALLVVLLAACPSPPPPTTPATAPAAATADETLSGVVIEKPWTKTEESWNAGGSEYLVLDVGGAAVRERSAAEGVLLLPSDAVPAEKLRALIGARVEVRGVYVAAQPYTPGDPAEQYPTGPDGKPLPRGAGFRVLGVVTP